MTTTRAPSGSFAPEIEAFRRARERKRQQATLHPGSAYTPPTDAASRAEARERADASLLRDINPFRRNVVENPWQPGHDVPDVESIYAGETRRSLQVMKEVHATAASQGVLLLGEAGAGKSHLLRRLTARYRESAIYVHLYSPTSLGTVFRTIARAVAVNLAETPPGARGRQIDQFVDRLVARHAFAAFGRAARSPSDRQDLLRLVDDRGAALWDDEEGALRVLGALEKHLRSEEPALDRSYLRAFLRARVRTLDTLALDWLKGEALDDDDAKQLGVSRAIETEEDAFEALRSLGYLSRFHKPVVIAFDQTENLPEVDGKPGIRLLVNAICRLHPLPNFVFVLVCPTDVWTRKYRHGLHQSERQRVENLVLPLGMSGLSPMQLEELLAARLATIYQGFSPPYPSYPFRPDYLAALSAQVQLQPREALNHFRDLVEEAKEAGTIREIGADEWARRMGVPVHLDEYDAPEPDPSPAPAAILEPALADPLDDLEPEPPRQAGPDEPVRLERLAEEIFAEELDVVRATRGGTDLSDEDTTRALQTALEALAEHGPGPHAGGWRVSVEPPIAFGERTVLVFGQAHEAAPPGPDGTPELQRSAVIVCESRRGQSFAAVVGRCTDQTGRGVGRWPRFVLVRGRTERASWSRGREHLAKFLKRGGVRVRPDDLGRGHLAALLSITRRARAGDLLVGERTVSEEELLEALVLGGVLEALPVVRSLLGWRSLSDPALGSVGSGDGRAAAQARRRSSVEDRLARLVARHHILGFRRALERLQQDDPDLDEAALLRAVHACRKRGAIAVLGKDVKDPLLSAVTG